MSANTETTPQPGGHGKTTCCLGGTGGGLVQANGALGGQTVAHVHLHVVPRHEDDGITFTWPRQEPPAAVLAGYAERLRAALEAVGVTEEGKPKSGQAASAVMSAGQVSTSS